MTVIIANESVAPTDIGIDPCKDLICEQRVLADGAITIPFPLAGTPRTEICENRAKYLVGEPRAVEVEKKVTRDNLRLATETREHNQLAVLSCGVHKERAVECFEAHRPDDDVGLPRVAPLAETEGA